VTLSFCRAHPRLGDAPLVTRCLQHLMQGAARHSAPGPRAEGSAGSIMQECTMSGGSHASSERRARGSGGDDGDGGGSRDMTDEDEMMQLTPVAPTAWVQEGGQGEGGGQG